ncbi:adenosine receptor A2a-like [Montipora capricornis]|uniref:adenosine receptor A2a-like n=1 Tax=Montipora capricornis TaxID=246305 RepID=UPI0035F182B5
MDNQNDADNSYYLLMKQSTTIPTETAKILAGVNIFLAIAASLGNGVILMALPKVSSVHPPTKLLFQCLAVTDLCVGVIIQPLFIPLVLDSVLKINMKLFASIYLGQAAISYTLCSVSFFITTTIAVDRLLALRLGLRYKHVVNLRRVKAAILFASLLGVCCGLTHSFWNYQIAWIQVVVCIVLWALLSLLSYTKIFLTLRKQHGQVQETNFNGPLQSPCSRNPLNIAVYTKTVSDIAWVQLALGACYFPFVIMVFITITTRWSGESTNVLWISAVTLIYLNSSLNPLLYCWKMKQVRKAARVVVRQICCCPAI